MKTITIITRSQQIEKAKKARKILSLINDEFAKMRCLSNNEFMSNNLLRLMLNENENMRKKWDILSDRKFKIERILFKNA